MNPLSPPSPKPLAPVKALSTNAKLLIGGTVAAIILVIVLIAAAAGGGNSPDAFLDELQDQGFYNRAGDSAQLGLGYDVCESLEAGSSEVSVAHTVYLNNDLDMDESALFVDIAQDNLC